MKKALYLLLLLLLPALTFAQGRVTLDEVVLIPQGSPSNPTEGLLHYNSAEKALYVYNGTTYVRVGGSGGSGEADGYISNATLNVNSLDFTGTLNGFNGSVDLSKYLDNTDTQTLSLVGTDLTITGGNTVDLSGLGGGGTASEVTYDNTSSGINAADVQSALDEVAVKELTQAEFDALSTADKLALGPYILLPPAPASYTVVIDNDPVLANGTDTFTFTGAEVGSFYDYSISSDGGGNTVTGYGVIATPTDQITNIDLSGLTDGTITLSTTLTNAGGNTQGTDTAQKTSGGGAVDIFPTGNASSEGVNESNALGTWSEFGTGTLSVITEGVDYTDTLGGSYAVRITDAGGTDRNSDMRISIPGHNIGQTYTATVRIRRVQGTGEFYTSYMEGSSDESDTIDFDAVSNGTWISGTISYTADATDVIIKFNVKDFDGTLTTSIMDVSEITVTQD